MCKIFYFKYFWSICGICKVQSPPWCFKFYFGLTLSKPKNLDLKLRGVSIKTAGSLWKVKALLISIWSWHTNLRLFSTSQSQQRDSILFSLGTAQVRHRGFVGCFRVGCCRVQLKCHGFLACLGDQIRIVFINKIVFRTPLIVHLLFTLSYFLSMIFPHLLHQKSFFKWKVKSQFSNSQMRGILNVLNIFLLPDNIWPWNQEQLLCSQILSSTERCRKKAQFCSWVKCAEMSAQSCCCCCFWICWLCLCKEAGIPWRSVISAAHYSCLPSEAARTKYITLGVLLASDLHSDDRK